MKRKSGSIPLLPAAALALLTGAATAQDDSAAPHAGMLRTPDVSETHVVFSFGNDLWLVAREGGEARPLASPPGQELFPRFSPDGATIAFQGNYDGDRDLYTLPAEGGVAHRVTHHPSNEILLNWGADGQLLFMAGPGFSSFPKSTQILRVSPEGGMPEPLPIPYGGVGDISPDGKWLAYTPYTRDHRTWKRYMGGMATDIWLYDLENQTSRRITDWGGTDSWPMWHGTTLYYVSDAGPEHRRNIWRYDSGTGRHQQVTKFEDFDVKTPSMGPGSGGQGEIVFQLGSDLRLLDLGSGESRALAVRVPGDRTFLRPRPMDHSDNITSWGVSPSAKRAVVTARGDVWTLPAEHGSPRNLTRSADSAERSAEWSPDGRWIAYFSDRSGEYELWITQSDGKGETRQLTDGGGPFKVGLHWSPDSEHIVFMDKGGAIFLHSVDGEETWEVDRSQWGLFGGVSPPSWSHDGKWLTYSRAPDEFPGSAVFLYDVENRERHQVTSGMFPDQRPVFDKKGDWIFYSSNRRFQPTYSDVDTTFIYGGTEVLLAVPLRADIESPWAPESDEETWEEDEDEEDEQDAEGDGAEESDDSEDEGDDAAAAGEGEDESSESAPVEDDGISGTWEGTLKGEMTQGQEVPMTVTVSRSSDGTLTGSVTVPMGSAEIVGGSFDKATGALELKLVADDGSEVTVNGTVSGDSLEGNGEIPAMGASFEVSLTRTQKGTGGDGEDGDGEDEEEDKEPVVIDIEGFEARGLQLPVPAGSFGRLAVNDKNQLIYARLPAMGDGSPSIKLFDLKDEKKDEKTVTSGANFDVSHDGKHLLVVRGGSAFIMKASAGGKAEKVPTSGMEWTVDPRAEWRQMFVDAWRIMRDYFYDPNMHGVDWDAVRENYGAMIEHCASREDVAYVLGEMIAELNVGHAYLLSAGDVENQPSKSVGRLGVDWELNDGAYRIARVHEGGPWDSDARGPLSQPGVDVGAGDYVLAVNGVPLDTSKDPWAAFVGLAGETVTLTVSEKPTLDDDAREVVVEPIGSDFNLRFRSWIEKNRAQVDEKTDGRVGYIYVTNTGIPGQNDLFRQFVGQFGRDALIIDERWNGGGQIPTRFIELLNRPVTNYWAGRDGKDWHWPPDSHQGPKCMLINGMAGSGGDAFPAYFRMNGLGKLIGTRTWGGLVGISGNPSLVDGGAVSAPTFAYFEKDGTWGIEGHGVEPDIEVVDDPAEMTDGRDVQLDAAIEHILGELERNPYRPAQRPAYPDRAGMGVTDDDK